LAIISRAVRPLSGVPGFASCNIAKGAIMALTRVAAKEWGRFGITTNCFLPVIKGESFDSSPQGRAAAEQITMMSPLGLFGDAYKEASPIVAFMASEGAHYLNGQMIGVDGGLTLIA
jgi:3-oxoacyl-[acyl-carrier protein] reductase